MHYIKNIVAVLFAAFFVIAAPSCSKPKTFKVKGEIVGGGNTNLYLKYYGDNAVKTGVTVAREGKFEGEFSSALPTVVEMLDIDYRVLARFYICNGEEVEVTIDRANPTNSTVKGTPVNEQWSKLINDNADILSTGDTKQINELVEKIINSNPDDIVSALMFAVYYDASADPVKAGEVIEKLPSELRSLPLLEAYATVMRRFANPVAYKLLPQIRYRTPDKDTAYVLDATTKPLTLLILSNENSKRTDSIVPKLKDIRKAFKAEKLQMLDLVLFSDTSTFKRVVKRDSANWEQGWLPGGILGKGLDELTIPTMPYYIVADSSGSQIYRGTSLIEAEEEMLKLQK